MRLWDWVSMAGFIVAVAGYIWLLSLYCPGEDSIAIISMTEGTVTW